MPRLPGALAVLLTMSVCIGFNTIRYPVVWQCVAPSNPWPSSASPEVGPVAGAAKVADSPPAAASNVQTAPPKMRVVCNGSVCCLVKETVQPPASHDPLPPRVDSLLTSLTKAEAKAAPAAGRLGSASRDAAPIAALPRDSLEATVAAPLVPIVRPPKPAAATVLTSAFETLEGDRDRLAQDKVRRLPPADRVFPAQGASARRTSAGPGSLLPVQPAHDVRDRKRRRNVSELPSGRNAQPTSAVGWAFLPVLSLRHGNS